MIETFDKYSDKSAAVEKIKEIFYISSARQTFASEQDKTLFWENWTKYYFENHPDLIYIYLKEGRILGYLMGCFDSKSATDYFSQRIPSYLVFQDLFSDYPAHLHINCHPASRGQGVGKKLTDRFADDCVQNKLAGLHIVTSPDQRNVSFYTKQGFDFRKSSLFKGFPLLFMGKKLCHQ